MRVLLVWPAFPTTYWGMEYALPLLGARSLLPPLGLLTVAAMLPRSWEVRLCGLNVRELAPREVDHADVVFVSGMLIQRRSMEEVAGLARAHGKTVVAGGPYATTSPEALERYADCVVMGEAESL